MLPGARARRPFFGVLEVEAHDAIITKRGVSKYPNRPNHSVFSISHCREAFFCVYRLSSGCGHDSRFPSAHPRMWALRGSVGSKRVGLETCNARRRFRRNRGRVMSRIANARLRNPDLRKRSDCTLPEMETRLATWRAVVVLRKSRVVSNRGTAAPGFPNRNCRERYGEERHRQWEPPLVWESHSHAPTNQHPDPCPGLWRVRPAQTMKTKSPFTSCAFFSVSSPRAGLDRALAPGHRLPAAKPADETVPARAVRHHGNHRVLLRTNQAPPLSGLMPIQDIPQTIRRGLASSSPTPAPSACSTLPNT